MDEDRAASSDQPAGALPQRRSVDFERDHACFESRRTARRRTAPTRRFTIASPAGASGEFRKRYSRRSPLLASRQNCGSRQQPCQGPPLRQWRKRGAEIQAIGLNSKIHAIVDEFLRRWALILTPGNTADCVMAHECVSLIPGIKELLADKGYDTDAFRAFLKSQKIKPVIPGKSETQRHRTLLWPAQGFPAYCHALRQTRRKLLLRALPRRHCRLRGYGSAP